jgi:DNA repair photolyase
VAPGFFFAYNARMGNIRPSFSGRGAGVRPRNRFTGRTAVVELDLAGGTDDGPRHPATTFLDDHARSVVSENTSPDVGFRYSLNPYRGCEHGCPYCYARPTHEYLGYDAGLDFETRILVKRDAARLFRAFLSRDAWVPEPVALSGVTDPYQPCEREYGVTRQCLDIAWSARQPISIITKNALVVRDLDLLSPMAAEGLVHVTMSVTTLDPALGRAMEPRASAPAARLRAIRTLADAGVPVRVNVAPVVPGLTCHELPAILTSAKAHGATAARYILLRLPLTVEPVFLDWLSRAVPERREKVLSRIRAVRDGRLSDGSFGRRMTGTGETADQIATMFRVFAARLGLPESLPPYDCTRFRSPADGRGQGRLF